MENERYKEAFKKHPLILTQEKIKKDIRELLSKTREKPSKALLGKICSFIDYTSLNSTDNKDSIWKFTDKINQLDGTIPEIENNVATICVYPNFVKTVREALTSNVAIASVSGGFPSAQTFLEIKIAETSLAISDGADEIDIVMNVGHFLAEEYEELCDEISEIREICRAQILKVIIETGALDNHEQVYNASILSIYSGADFIKTSSGKSYPGATPQAAYVICHAIKSYYEETGRKIGIKVSGGISQVNDALDYYDIVKFVLGEEWLTPSLFRIGSSRLLDNLLWEIKKD